MILGLDLSLTSTGIATVDRDGTHTSALLTPGDAPTDIRLAVIYDTISRLVRDQPICHVVIEDLPRNPRFGGAALGMVHACYWLAVRNYAVTTTAITPASLKTYATGSGNASKGEMLAEAIRRLGYAGHDHNEADALWLAHIGAALLDWRCAPELPQTHLRALTKLRKAAA